MGKRLLESLINTILLLLLVMAAVSYNGKLFGKKAEDVLKQKEIEETILPPVKKQLQALGINAELTEVSKGYWSFSDGATKGSIINTSAYDKGIYGYGGPLPMLLLLDEDERIKDVLLLENYETPRFLRAVENEGIVKQWIGKDFKSMGNFTPDALAGATITSDAINQSIYRNMAGINKVADSLKWYKALDLKTIVALIVLALAVFVSFRSKKYRKLRTVQLILNTTVLGFWCGKFISMKVIFGWTANGFNFLSSIAIVSMLVLAILLPVLFKKKSFYCYYVCPFGSAQELMGKLSKKKWHPGKNLMKVLKHTQVTITLLLFFSMWLGVASDILDYEPFSAFLFQHASVAVLTIALVSLLIAVITPRPWCRFACPTGQILEWTTKMK